MLEPGGDFDLVEEPLGAKDLDRHPAAVREVLGQIHGGHAAMTDLPLDPIAVGERGRQSRQRIGHGVTPTTSFGTTREITIVTLSVPPPSSASWSSCSHAWRALVIVPSTSAIRASVTCLVSPSEQSRCTLCQSESRRLTTGAVVLPPSALERMLAMGERAATVGG